TSRSISNYYLYIRVRVTKQPEQEAGWRMPQKNEGSTDTDTNSLLC
uniref:Uncharacterized protein n=1 Tax=Anopheles dirus TaxID=7168 RepID=A0A182NX81_9DIPT